MARFTDDLQNNAAGEILISGLSERIVLPDATAMFQGDYSRSGPDLVIKSPEGSIIRVVDYFSSDQTPDLYSEQGAILTADIVGRLAGTQNPMVYAQSGTPSGQVQIGQVETLEGTAFATRANGQRVALQVGDPVFQDDLVETADDSNLGLTFIDETVFSLSANARMILDELVYEPGGSDNSMVMNLVQGTFVFVTGQVAPTGEMLVETPVATMGIRGTTPIVMIEGTNGNTEFGILKDPDGKIGAYELRDKITGQTIDRVIDEGTILQLDQAGGTPSAITVDAARLAERAEAQSNAYFLHTVARARINAQQQNDTQQNQDGQPADGADPITTESIGEEAPPESGGLSVDPVVVDDGDGQEDNNEEGNEDPNSSGEQQSDGQSGGSSSNIDTNIAPIVTDQTFQLSEDVGIAQGPLAVTDADGPGTLSYEIIDQPAFGAVLSNGDGTFTFIADPIFNTLKEGEVTAVSFTYRATDEAGGVSDVGTVTLQILGLNDAPIATAINVGSTNEDAGPLFIDLLGTALDPDFGDDLDTQNVTVTSSNPARAAIFAIDNETGGFTLDPNQFNDLAVGEAETLTVAYTIIDSFGGSTTNTASVIIEGRNDVPVITAVNVAGAVTDIAEDANDPPSANAGDQSAQGSIDFADVDRSDRPIATEATKSVVALAQGGGEIILTAGQLAAIEDAFTITPLAGNTNNGTVNWDYTIPESSLDFLGAGETVTAIFTITIDDTNGGVATQDVTITINVAVDTPVITIGAGDSAAETLIETDGGLFVTDTLTVNDVDLSDTVTASVVSVVASGTTQGLGPDNAALLAMFTVTATPIAADVGDTNNIVWTFDSAAEAFNYLDDGESLILTYTVRATDDELTTDDQTVSVTITGTNDVPDITVAAGDSAAKTLVETDAGLTVSDTLTVNDLDLSDAVTASVVSVAPSGTTTGLGLDNAALLAMFSVTAGSIAANVGDANNLVWTFDSGSEAFNYLDDGESLTLTYTVRATDDNATTDDQTVSVTITGTNDVPDITVAAGDSAAKTLVETDAGLTVSDTLTVNDLDLSDAVTASVVSVTPSGTTTGLGLDNAALLVMFSVTAGSIAANVGDANNLVWTFDSGSEAFNYLDDGESLTLTYTVRATDDSATTDDQTVSVTITGTNDVPDITVAAGDSAAKTLVETDAGLTVSDTLTVNDLDLSDAVTASVVSVTPSGTTTGLGLDNAALLNMFSVTAGSIAANVGDANNIDWTFDSGSEAFNYLDDGESLTLTYTVRATDDSATTDDQTVAITITGTNDAPVIAAIAQTNLTETTDTSDVTGLVNVAFNDIDLNDTGHTAQITNVSTSGVDGGLVGLTPAQLQGFITLSAVNKAVGSDQGSLTASFTAGSDVFDYLAGGEKVQLDYTLEITDGNGVSDTEIFRIEVTGTNDAPEITSTAQIAAVTEAAETAVQNPSQNAGDLQTNGVLSFTDVDVTDTGHTTSVSLLASGTLGDFNGNNDAVLLALFATTVTNTAALADGTVAWDFTGSEALFDYLADGESLILQYSVDVSDPTLTSNTQTVTITVNGANDAPTVTAAINAGTTDQNAATVTIDLLANASDVDTSDDLDTANVIATSSNTGRTVIVNVDNETGQLTLDPSQFNDLNSGESETITIQYDVTDGIVSTPTTATLVVNGANDAPTVSGPVDAGTTNEDASPVTIDLLANANDVDGDDLNTTRVSVTSSNTGREVTFTVDDETGMLTIDPGQFGDLNAGESETLTVDYGVFESNLEFSAGITGQMVIPNSGFFLVVDFDAQTTAAVARVGSQTTPASPPTNGVVILVNPNNDDWRVAADSYSNGVATARDTSEFTISNYTGGSSTSGNVQIFQGASSSAALNWTGTNIATADGPRTFSIDINNIGFTANPPGDLTIGSSGVTVTPDVPATATLVVEGRDDGEVIGLTAAPGGTLGAVTGDTDLSLAELSPIIDAAISRWADAGLTNEQITQLQDVTFEIADLGDGLLGRSEGGHIVIDDDAAGRGWFIDTTPLEDSEFANALSDTHLRAEAGQIPVDQIDLLTSVLHEFGHELGFDHVEGPDAAGDLLFEELGTGERRLPNDINGDPPVVGAEPNAPEGPIANDDGLAGEFRINPGGSIDILVSELLANDVDPNGEQFDLTEIFESTGGSATLEQVGSETVVRFTASDSAENGETGSFQYQVTNESGGVGFAMVDIIIDDMSSAV